MELQVVKGFLDVNIYFLINTQNKTAILIDCGVDYNLVMSKAKELGVNIKALLLTHAHYDHVGCAKQLQQDGVKVYISKQDKLKLTNEQNLSSLFGVSFDSFTPDFTFIDGDSLCIEGEIISVFVTPGHTDGSAVFMYKDMLFTGDTLFCGTVGRTDFPTGNINQLKKSILRLYNLEGDYKVYPGHSEFTTLENERKYNMFIKLW